MSQCSPCAEDDSEVLIVMFKMGLIPLVHFLTSFLHVLGQSRRSAAEHADFTHLQEINVDVKTSHFVQAGPGQTGGIWRGWTNLRVNFLQRAEKGHKRRTAEVGDGPQAGEETAVPHLLKMALTHILTTQSGENRERSLVYFFIPLGTQTAGCGCYPEGSQAVVMLR